MEPTSGSAGLGSVSSEHTDNSTYMGSILGVETQFGLFLQAPLCACTSCNMQQPVASTMKVGTTQCASRPAHKPLIW